MFGLAVLLFDYLLEKRRQVSQRRAGPDRVGFCARCNLASSGFAASATRLSGFNGSFAFDSFAVVAKSIIVLATALVVLISVKYLEIEEANQGEYYALLLFAAVGMMFMVSGTDLIVLFIALEVMALCEYVLTGFLRGKPAIQRSGGEVLPAGRVFLRACCSMACRCFTESAARRN